MNYYNEHDPKAAAWLRELIRAGLISAGDVDERDIQNVQPADLAGYIQCHFFAGIGGWSYALRLAGWPDDEPVWTGSCPCQPFSSAGKRKSDNDSRHLWPAFRSLISECRPPIIFGEQVASPLGREWLSGVRIDVEALGYALGAADLSAAGVRAPHIRQRLMWVAYSRRTSNECGLRSRETPNETVSSQGNLSEREWCGIDSRGGSGDCRLGNPERIRRGQANGEKQEHVSSEVGRNGFWSNAVGIACADGKQRRIEPGIEPLAHGVPGRVGLLRGYGNAIVPQCAAEFIQAASEALVCMKSKS